MNLDKVIFFSFKNVELFTLIEIQKRIASNGIGFKHLLNVFTL